MNRSVIAVHPRFDGTWPWAADRMHELWRAEGDVEFFRLPHGDDRPLAEAIPDPATVARLVAFDVPVTATCLDRFSGLREAALLTKLPEGAVDRMAERGVALHRHTSEGYWGQSVAEFGLALTLAALRRIPQTYREMLSGHGVWSYTPADGRGEPGKRGQQFGDDPNFANGTIAGKRVRVVGAGNIGSRYASFCAMLGADVAAWDPVAPDPAFHRAGGRREWRLDDLVTDAEIFAPMMPLLDKTRGIVTAEHIRTLPKGCLVVLVTRAGIVDMPTLRERILADELALAADVFDVEPVPLDDPLLGRHNVVHTPHNAGRTVHANRAFVEELAAKFARRQAG